MASPFNPTAGVNAGSSAATTGSALSESQVSRAYLSAWAADVTYPMSARVSYAITVSAWAVGTTYLQNAVVSITAADGSILFFSSNEPSNLGNVPFPGSSHWALVAVNSDIAASWADTSADVCDVIWQSVSSNNSNNVPSPTSAFWIPDVPPATHGLAVPMQIVGPLSFQPPAYNAVSESQTTTGATVTVPDQTHQGNTIQGGFQLTATSAGTQTRTDNGSIKSVTLNAAATFSHTATFQMTFTVLDGNGQLLVPGRARGIPAAVWSVSGVKMTIDAVTGLLTGVSAGTGVVTVTIAGKTATVTMTCS